MDIHPQDPQQTIVASPAWETIVPTELVPLPADLVADARKFHAQVQERNIAHGYKGFDFETWIAELLRDQIYGHGFDPGAALDWVER